MVMVLTRLLLRSRQWNRGFTLIELLIVILIVGILAAVATPLYLGYIKDAKTAEAKAVAGSLWTAIQSNAIASCGNAVPIKDAYQKAGLTSDGKTNPARWEVTGSTPVTVACVDGAITPDTDVFTIKGSTADVSFIEVKLNYAKGNTPPSRLQCNTGGTGGTFVDC
jgi:prepilin-type N-terminal cleavage/methylation domain-containing protein